MKQELHQDLVNRAENFTPMKKLLKTYGLQSPEDYFDMCVESYINGNKQQAKNQYMAMPREKRKLMMNYLLCDYEGNKEVYHFFFNLL